MEIQSKDTADKGLNSKTILYGILIIVVALALIVVIAKYAFNMDLVNFDQLLGGSFQKTTVKK